jgi:tetratricopeptide (TPR) repeat protein
MASIHILRAAIACCLTATAALSAYAGQAHPEGIEPGGAATGAAAAAALRARGVELGFNLDYPEALAAFREAIAADPQDATAYRLAAATLWISQLFQQGAVTVDDYLGQARANVSRKAPPEELAAAFRDYTTRALALAEKRLREKPHDVDAHFQVGAVAGFQASYTATVEGRVLGGLGSARRAYGEHKRCLEIDPRRKDAGLIVGMYRYAVSGLPAPVRLLARIAGFGSGREDGLRLIEEAARYPSDVQTNALFTLILIYNREGRHTDALRLIRDLQVRYPRNRLLWLEAGSTALRASRPAEALEALDEGLARAAKDPRPRAFGEEARWRYYRGAALVALRDPIAAERELRSVLAGEAHEWIKGRAHLELGKLADLGGSRTQAVSEYRAALRDCRPDRDTVCLDAAAKFIGAQYKQP